MGGLRKFKESVNSLDNDIDVKKGVIRNSVTSKIQSIMHHENVSKSDLATMMNLTKPTITNYLTGDRNFTIDTLTQIAFVLGYLPTISFRKKGIEKAYCNGNTLSILTEESIYERIEERNVDSVKTTETLTRKMAFLKVEDYEYSYE